MNVLSLFDGMSCGQIALNRCGISYDNYFASEIDKYAIIITQKNYPETIQLGDIKNVKGPDLPKIDLIMAGSPCQGFSFAGKQKAFQDERSVLFYEFVRLLVECRPDYFLLENVKMKKEYRDLISLILGVEPILINSNLVSAQNRPRLYWTNIPGVKQPEDKGIFLKDIIFSGATAVTFTERRTEEAKKIRKEMLKNGRDFSPRRAKEMVARKDGKSNCLTANLSKEHLILSKKAIDYMNKKTSDGRTHGDFKHHSESKNLKSATVVSNFFKGVPYNVLKDFDCIRKFHPVECERLQTVPDDYTKGVSNMQRYKMLGNGWTIDVITHILKGVKSK